MVIAFAVGIMVAFFVDETTGVKPGGYIVPGYLAVSTVPEKLAMTLGLVVCVLAILALAERFVLLYGRRRFAFVVLTGCVLKSALITVLPVVGLAPVGLLIIGFLIPGLVAHGCDHQGVIKTLGALIVATVVTRLLCMAVLG